MIKHAHIWFYGGQLKHPRIGTWVDFWLCKCHGITVRDPEMYGEEDFSFDNFEKLYDWLAQP